MWPRNGSAGGEGIGVVIVLLFVVLGLVVVVRVVS